MTGHLEDSADEKLSPEGDWMTIDDKRFLEDVISGEDLSGEEAELLERVLARIFFDWIKNGKDIQKLKGELKKDSPIIREDMKNIMNTLGLKPDDYKYIAEVLQKHLDIILDEDEDQAELFEMHKRENRFNPALLAKEKVHTSLYHGELTEVLDRMVIEDDLLATLAPKGMKREDYMKRFYELHQMLLVGPDPQTWLKSDERRELNRDYILPFLVRILQIDRLTKE